MTIFTLIGFIAAFCTTFSLFPQLFKALKTKETEDLSLAMFSMISFGTILWVIYGISRSDIVLIIANVIAFLLAFSLVLFKLRHG